MKFVLKVDKLQDGRWIARVQQIISPERPRDEAGIAAICAVAPFKKSAIDEVERQLRAAGYYGEVIQ